MNAQIVWDARELRRLPTLATGQCCDLKVDLGEIRVWVCRVGGGVTVERQDDRGCWRTAEGGCVAWKNKLEGMQR